MLRLVLEDTQLFVVLMKLNSEQNGERRRDAGESGERRRDAGESGGNMTREVNR